MTYKAGAHLEQNDVIRYSLGELADCESNAFQNHVSWCQLCRTALEKVWFGLEAGELDVSPTYQEEGIDMCIDLIRRLDELVRMGERKSSLN